MDSVIVAVHCGSCHAPLNTTAYDVPVVIVPTDFVCTHCGAGVKAEDQSVGVKGFENEQQFGNT